MQPKPGQGEHPRRNDASVGHHDNRVGRDGFELRAKLSVVADLFRLRNGNASSQSGLLYGRCGYLLIAAHGTVGLRNHESDVVSCGEQSVKSWNGELGRPAENQLEGARRICHGCFTNRLRPASCESCGD